MLSGCCFAKKYKINGFCDPRYMPLQKRFEELFEKGYDQNSQLCMYVDGECIVNLWGETPSTCTVANYDNNSIQMIFSAGKTIGAMMIAIMVDQGLLDYNEPVATYWPEFAKNGKDKILLRDVLCHDAGIPELSQRLDFKWTLTENIKQNMVGKAIEDTPKREFPHGMTRKYHAINKDFITNEIFRRVEPKGRTMGEYFHQEIKEKFQL